MDAGQVEVLVILGGNPVFTAPADLKFAERLGKVSLVVYHGLYVDETAELCHWNVPEAHPLESWGDARAYDGTVTIMQPLIAPLYDGALGARGARDADSAEPGRTALEIVKDYWTRASAAPAAGRLATRTASVRQRRRVLEALPPRRLHPRHGNRGGGQATPFKAVQRAAPAAAGCSGSSSRRRQQLRLPARCGTRRCSGRGRAAGSHQRPCPLRPRRRRLEIIFRPDPNDLGRPLRQQRLAAGAAEAADEGDVGHRGVDQPASSPRTARLDERRRHRAELPRQHRAHAGLHRSRAARRVGDGVLRLRPPHGRPRRQRPTSEAQAVQRLPAAHVGRAVVRQRPRDRQDRRALPAGDDAGAPRDGRPRAGPRRDARRSTRSDPEVIAAHAAHVPEDADAVSRTTSTTATSGAWRST